MTSSLSNIDKYISELLYVHDCVILPDFGGFVANYAPATIHPTQHTFHPPSKNIAFNKNLKNNDGLLAHFISSTENISFQEAINSIMQYVNICHGELRKGNKVLIANVGTLYFDIEKNIQFEQDKSINYLLDSFGLSEFQSPAIKRTDYRDKLKTTFQDRTGISNERKKINVGKLIALTVSASVIAALVWIPLKTDILKNTNYSNLNPFSEKIISYKERSKEPNSLENTLTTEESGSTTFSALAADSANYVNISFIDDLTPLTVRLNEPEKVAKDTKHNSEAIIENVGSQYHIIGGCFQYAENAEKLTSTSKEQNLEAAIIGQNKDGLYMVSFGGFQKKREALKKLKEIRKINPKAWLLKR